VALRVDPHSDVPPSRQIVEAYLDLETLGVVEGRNGSGVFVREGGPAVARAQRRKATLEAFRRAARAALRAGHEREALEHALAALARESARVAAMEEGA
jgi:DNA-binding transcriptional regulator YhcF (GntR family)